MFRVRKLNRKLTASSRPAHTRRPKLAEFVEAIQSLVAQERSPSFPTHAQIQQLNRELHAPRGAITIVQMMKRWESAAIVVPVSDQGSVPSAAEVLRVATAHCLSDFLQSRGIEGAYVALWPGIPSSLDNGARCVLDRNGQPLPTAGLRMSTPIDADPLLGHLPTTEFTGILRSVLEEAWHVDPLVMKMRLLFRLFPHRAAVAICASHTPRPLPGMSDDRVVPRMSYRAHLARLTESFPVLCMISPVEGGTSQIESAIGASPDGDFITLPSVPATLIEGKVERWLDKYGLRPEHLLTRVQPGELVSSLFPQDPSASVSTSRERLLAKLITLQNQLEEIGYAQPARSLDKIANRVDGQFDQLAKAVKTSSRTGRETAMNQLTKARSYLRPLGRSQAASMSILHYLNFYGIDFAQVLAASLEVHDGRHHLIYLGA